MGLQRTIAVDEGRIEVPFVDLAIQYGELRDELHKEMAAVFESCEFVLGAALKEFEAKLAEYCETEFAIGVGSGLDALTISLMAVGLESGDEVIIPANTFIATALAVSAAGGRPVLVDCDPATYNIDVSKIPAAITERSRAIIPVHLYGQPADLDQLLALGEKHRLAIIEDSAQAHGARYKGRRCGSMGRTGCLSFYPGKNLGAYGDGGAVLTSDESIAAEVRRLRNYGADTKYVHEVRGLNSRLDSLQAAILGVKLRHLDKWNTRRRQAARAYCEGLNDLAVELPKSTFGIESVFHLFVIQIDDRDEFVKYMRGLGVSCGIHYPVPVHMQPVYGELGYERGSFPVTERIAERLVSLPMFPEISAQQLEYIVDGVRSFCLAGA